MRKKDFKFIWNGSEISQGITTKISTFDSIQKIGSFETTAIILSPSAEIPSEHGQKYFEYFNFMLYLSLK